MKTLHTIGDLTAVFDALDQHLDARELDARIQLVGDGAMMLSHQYTEPVLNLAPATIATPAIAAFSECLDATTEQLGLDPSFFNENEASRLFGGSFPTGPDTTAYQGDRLVIETPSAAYMIYHRISTPFPSDKDILDAAHLCRVNHISATTQLEHHLTEHHNAPDFAPRQHRDTINTVIQQLDANLQPIALSPEPQGEAIEL